MVLDADSGDRSGELTLAVSLDAARSMADPAAVVDDAERWSRYVGLVDDDTEAVAAFAREYGIDDDFALDDRDVWRSMADVHDAADTPRHVFIGAGPEHRRIADQVGWEYLTVREAAEKAGWELATDAGGAGGGRPGSDDGGGSGVVPRLRRAVAERWPF